MGVSTRKFNPEPDSELFDPKTGNCSIEYFNACKDPYRVSPNKPPVGWPWFTYKTSKAADLIFDQLDESILIVLARHKIRLWTMGNYSFAPRHTPEDAKDMILIRTRDDFDISWKKAASEIYYGIVEPAATAAGIQLGVEIRNNDKMYMDASYFIKDDATIRSIARTQPYVLGAVMAHCPGKWTSIAYHNRGRPHYKSDKRVTAVIFVEPGAIHAWGKLEEKITSTIQSGSSPSPGFPRDIDINVEILPGRISLSQQCPQIPTLRSPEGPIDYHCLSYLPMVPSNESSIAPSKCIDAAGTPSPVVNYREASAEEFKQYFLTCYNVIATGIPNKETHDMFGIGTSRAQRVGRMIAIEYPAKYDVRATRTIHERISEGGKESGREDVVTRFDKIAAEGPVGLLRFASGNRLTYTNHRMDWALIELEPGHHLQNLLPMYDRFIGDHFYGIAPYRVKEGDTVRGTSNCLSSSWYGKVGRTSRCTGGEQGLIKRVIRWDDDEVSHEYEFKAIHAHDRFAQVGDSGSLVFNWEKEWAGMLFAVERSSGIGFVTPAFELLRDIEETTGGKITLA